MSLEEDVFCACCKNPAGNDGGITLYKGTTQVCEKEAGGIRKWVKVLKIL